MMNRKIVNTINMMKQKTRNAVDITKEKTPIAINRMQKKTAHFIAVTKQKATVFYTSSRKRIGLLSRKQLISMGAGVVGVMVISIAIGVAAGGGDANQKEPLVADTGETDWALTINGAEVVRLATMQEGAQVINGIKEHYRTAGSQIVSIDFVEEVVLEAKGMDQPEVQAVAEGEEAVAGVTETATMTTQAAIDYILTGSMEPKTYTVQGGDNLWNIAMANGINIYELQAMNPQLEEGKLSIGQEINLYAINPFVTVQMTEIVTATERIEYETVYENSNSLYKGQSMVKTAGVYGSKDIKTEVVKQNGMVVASNVLEEVITAEPQAQIALKGTQSVVVATAGSGVLSSPQANIEVSSAFGSRGGGRHYGVDLRNPKGTPILAADAGTVIGVSSGGSYGNIIKIDHGGGLQTYYAHCDSMCVSTGDVVAKGEVIGTVGKTGNATGYVLHFEVRVNGVAQNPMNYL